MRGAKKDIATTKLLYANGLFQDRRSFISLGAQPHLYLKGADVVNQRIQVWNRDKGKCQLCFLPLYANDWEMDHEQCGLIGRCDCLHNLRAVHPSCHRKRHVQTRFRGEPRQLSVDDNFMEATDAKVEA